MRVLIVGGGIGGLTAAVALQQHGIQAAVYESAPELKPVGKGIWVPPNAMQVFERLGLDEAVAERGLTLNRVEVRTKNQRVLQALDLVAAKEKYGHAITSLHRAALHDTLVEHVQSDTLHLGKECTGIAKSDNGVTAQFEDGTEAVGDVLIGADGIHSVVRKSLFPEATLQYAGQTCYRGIAQLELKERRARTCAEVWGGPVRFGFSAIGRDAVYWFAPITAPADGPVPSDIGETLSNRYADFPTPIPKIIRHTPNEEIIRTDLYDLAPLDTWSRGRVVLLGDAAHAMTPNLGQGGAQAIEDGFVLGTTLARHCDDPEQAIARYEQVRLEPVQRLVWIARTFGTIAHIRNRWLQTVRNWVLRHTPERINRTQMDRMYSLDY